jgi:hypothetical protein
MMPRIDGSESLPGGNSMSENRDPQERSEQDREPPLTALGRPTAQRARSRRALVWIAAVTALGASAAVAGCGGAPSRAANAKESARIRQLDQLLGGIPESSNALGSPGAPVTLQLFLDVECANTREFVQQALWGMVRRWVRPGQLRLEFHSIEDGSEPRDAFLPPQLATLAAGRQSRLWYFLSLYYDAQEDLGTEMADSCFTPRSLPAAVARRVPGLDVARWAREQRDQGLSAEVSADQRLAAHAGLTGTPSVRLGATGAGRWQTFEPTADQATRTHPVALLRAIERLVRGGHPEVVR